MADGKIVAAAQEERFTRKKHDEVFPVKAAQYCMVEADIRNEDLGFRGFLRKAFTEVRPFAESLPCVGPGRLSLLSPGNSHLAERQTIPTKKDEGKTARIHQGLCLSQPP